ncbi:mucin-6-like [Emydura macquarii macquarii]|uniref:mucin-6-like n=1 Tax=Emydura macquarii macquarii TaxID=1129001 RepID=UPI00352B9329
MELCREVEYEEQVTYKGCTTNVTLTRCEGMCPSSAKLNIAKMMVDLECGCCMPLTMHKKELKMPCSDPDFPGKKLIMEIIIFGGCVCNYDGCTH